MSEAPTAPAPGSRRPAQQRGKRPPSPADVAAEAGLAAARAVAAATAAAAAAQRPAAVSLPPPPTVKRPPRRPTPSPSQGKARTPARTPPPPRSFPEHWPPAELRRALEAGAAFRAALRVNASDPTQAFATLPGLPRDVLVRGLLPQNRAIEGDEVALRILPPAEWQVQAAVCAPGRDGRGGGGGGGSAGGLNNAVPAGALRGRAGGDLVASPTLATAPSGGDAAYALTPLAYDDDDGASAADNADGAGGAADVAALGSALGDLDMADAGAGAAAGVPAGAGLPAPPWYCAAGPEAALAAVAAALDAAPAGARVTAEVVGVLEPSRRRDAVVGVLLKAPGRGGDLTLVPSDVRLPRMRVPPAGLRLLPPAQAAALRAEAAAPPSAAGPPRTLVCAALTRWPARAAAPEAELRGAVGRAGDARAEVAALLAAEGVEDDDEFTPEVLACLPPGALDGSWAVPPEELAARRDLRSARVFSVDPPTARDLDDALSVEPAPGGAGALRVGAHIADVAHFVRPGTPLDAAAAARGTSVYLVDRVVPMLPRPLCEGLCSLNPGVDRLAFSIVWDITEGGEVRGTWAGRTVVRSCAQLAYADAQAVIDAAAAGAPPPGPPPGRPLHGGHAWADVAADVLALHRVAAALRARRTAAGSLRLDNVRLAFPDLDGEGLPTRYEVYAQREANWLVEELMLLANMTAARLVADAFPDRALLRCHPPPAPAKLAEAAAAAAALGVRLDVSSSGALAASLAAARAAPGADAAAAAEVATLLCTKPMQLARYFCTGEGGGAAAGEAGWRHYALACARYTHFTSPIRRYPDVVVHRLLAAALGAGSHRQRVRAHALPDGAAVAAVAAACNARKQAAKNVQDGCARLYLSLLLGGAPRACAGVAVALGGPRFFDAYVPALGVEVRVHVADALRGGERALRAAWRAGDRALALERRREAAGTPAGEPDYSDVPALGALRVADAGLAPAALPLTLRPLARVPLLLSARRSGVSGSPTQLFAKLWLE